MRAFTNKKLLEKTYTAWIMYHKISQIKKQMKLLAKNFRIAHAGFPLWVKWKSETLKKLEKKEKKVRANNNYVESLLVKSFVILKNYTKTKKISRINNQQADYLFASKVERKSLNSLKIYTKDSKFQKSRNKKLQEILQKYEEKSRQAAIIRVLLKWVKFMETAQKCEKFTQKIMGITKKINLRNGILKIKEFAMKKTEILKKIEKITEKNQISFKKKIMKDWLKYAENKKTKNHTLNEYTKIKKTNILQQIVSKWRETTLILKSLKNCSNIVNDRIKVRLRLNYWTQWKNAFLESVSNRKKDGEAVEYHTETLLVKAFASMKSHTKHHILKKQKNQKSISFNKIILQKKSLASFQEYAVNQKSRKINRFELSKRISQIDQYNLKETALRAFYGWYISRKRLSAGQNVLIMKQSTHIKKRYMQIWQNATKTITHKKSEQETIESARANEFYLSILKRKVLNALKKSTFEGIKKMKREKLHEIFAAWKVLSNETKMLKGYLKQCNIDEKYSKTPGETYRHEVPKMHALLGASAISPESSIEGISSNRLGSEVVTSALKSDFKSENVKEEQKRK